MSRKAWIAIGAAVTLLVVAGGGYALLLRSADEAVANAIAQLRADLPPGASFEHGPYDVDLLERSVVIETPVLDMGGQGGIGEIAAQRLLLSGLEPDAEEVRAARVIFETVRMQDAARPALSLRAESLELFDAVVPARGGDWRQTLVAARVGSARVAGLAFDAPNAVLALEEVRLDGYDRGNVGDIALEGLSVETRETGEDVAAELGSLALSGLDFRALLALSADEAAGLDEAVALQLVDSVFKGLTGFEMLDLKVDVAGIESAYTLSRLALEDPQLIDGRLVGGTGVLESLSMPVDPQMARQAALFVPGLPLGERISVSGVNEQRYDAQQDRMAFDYRMTVHDMLELAVSAALGDLDAPLHMGMGEADVQAALMGASLVEGRVEVADLGFVGPAVDALAGRQNLTPDAFRTMLVDEIGRGIRRLGLADLAPQATAAVARFLEEPGRIAIGLQPREPVPLLMLAIAGQPKEIAAILQPSIVAEPE